MKSQLVLVRHGKAEDRTLVQDDSARQLTPRGEQELQAILPHLKLFVQPDQEILIWSSPLRRAAQTAAILAEVFQNSQISTFEFISRGDISFLADELAKLKQPVFVIIAGHEPHLSEWSEMISGCPLPFKKGSAAGYKINSLFPLEGELRWFVQPRVLKKLSGGLREAGE